VLKIDPNIAKNEPINLFGDFQTFQKKNGV